MVCTDSMYSEQDVTATVYDDTERYQMIKSLSI